MSDRVTDDSDERVAAIRAWYEANVNYVKDGTIRDAIPDLLAHIDTIRSGFSAAISSAARANHAAHEAKAALDATTARLRDAEILIERAEHLVASPFWLGDAATFLKGAANG